jgi:g-D-glutamyl-meso-diaminopimelate peptidase
VIILTDLFYQLNEFYTLFEKCRNTFGYSLSNEPLYCFKIGNSGKKVLVMAGCHANEYITSLVACRFFEELYINRNVILGEFTVIPLLNPDGAKICLAGNNKYRGNGRGVDLNRNFDAGWDKISNVPKGNPYYKGIYPESEPESSALCRLCEAERYDAVCALHTQGEVIYTGFDGYLPKGEPEFSDSLSKITV